MPNYCENNLSIEGPIAECEDFMKNIKSSEEEVCFEILLPVPKNVEDSEEWFVDNYGTKWNGLNSEFFSNEVSFYTAWSPPQPFFDTVSKMYPNLLFTLTYIESGMDFAGIAIFKNGNRLRDEYDSCGSELAREIFGDDYIDQYFAN